jgi:hypothetical protein
MSSGREQRDLFVVVADHSMKAAVTGVLRRPESLRIRKITFDVRVHPQKDSGVLRRAHHLARPFAAKYRHALVVFDREGCGREPIDRARLEADVESGLARNGWADRAAAIVLDPELECWVWSDSPHVDAAIGWEGQTPALRAWLVEQGFLVEGAPKPERPKEAMEAAMRRVRKRRSSSIFRELAEKVSVQRCTDPAFEKLRDTLRQWFPAE